MIVAGLPFFAPYLWAVKAIILLIALVIVVYLLLPLAGVSVGGPP